MEDPAANNLWLAKGTPRSWLADGQHITVSDAPSRWGKISFAIRSLLGQHRVEADVTLPPKGIVVPVKLRLRTPESYALEGVRVDGRDWKDFSTPEETITLPAGLAGKIKIDATYRSKSN
jgi:hypothetical protein